MSANLDRALLLLNQDRPDLAESELRQALLANPNDGSAHAFLALCLARLGRHQEATQEAEAAVHLAPDQAFAHYALARVLHGRDHLKEAQAAIQEAIRLDPSEADYFAVLAAIQLDQRHWRQALESAETGLRLDAEHVGCNNTRAAALVHLGRKREASATLETALAREPENATTHANQGWALLHRGERAAALEHFREALRLNPRLEWAREGLVEALKAEHLLYGLMLRYFLWMSRLSRGGQWGVVLGGFVGYQVLRGAARAVPDLAPWLMPAMIAYLIFALLTWISVPMFDLLLRLHRYGRFALSAEQIVASNWVGAFVGAALLGALAWVLTRHPGALLLALLSGALVVPIAGTFQCPAGWPRRTMAKYTAAVAVLALVGLAVAVVDAAGEIDGTFARGAGGALLGLSLLGVMLSTFVANALAMARPRR